MSVFIIEDASHAEWCGEFSSYDDAFRELGVRAKSPWGVEPNKCPCISWKTCCRNYEIVEFDDSKGQPWEEISRSSLLTISPQGAVWNDMSKNSAENEA